MRDGKFDGMKDHHMKNDDQAAAAAASRRGFLKFMGYGAVGGGSVTLTSAAASGGTEGTPPKSGDGYSETEHVKTYYQLARF